MAQVIPYNCIRVWSSCGTSYDDSPRFPEPDVQRVCNLKTILDFWEDDDFDVIFISEKQCEGFPQLTWVLYEIHSPYFTRDYGRHAVFRALVYRGRVVFHEIFNISRRDGEHISGIPVEGILTVAEQTRIYRYLMKKEKEKGGAHGTQRGRTAGP